jgi:4-hydroxy-tetrahydrodipicolinate synthase
MFAGSLVAIVTPMRADGAIDFEAWARLLEFHLANGTDGIVVGGTTGESATLRDAELRELLLRASEQLHGRLPVIAGAGTSSTASTVERVTWLSELPIDGMLIVTPAYNRPPQEGLYRHFAAAAAASRKPVLLYNVPTRTAVDMKPATAARLAHVAGIVGIKEAVPESKRVCELVALCPADFVVLSGDDATARASIAAGARGVISVTANVAPRAMSDMLAAARRGDAQGAARLDAPLGALHSELFVEPNPIPVKWLLAELGLIGPGIRLPLTPLAAEHHAGVLAAARSAGVLAPSGVERPRAENST